MLLDDGSGFRMRGLRRLRLMSDRFGYADWLCVMNGFGDRCGVVANVLTVGRATVRLNVRAAMAGEGFAGEGGTSVPAGGNGELGRGGDDDVGFSRSGRGDG